MAVRNLDKKSSATLVPGLRLDLNPFAQTAGSCRVLDDVIVERGRTIRKAYSPLFQTTATTASGQVWDIVDYRYYRASAPHTQLLIFRSDGRIYRRCGGGELEIFPGTTSHPVLNYRPGIIQLSNQLFFSDKSYAYVYDGRTFRKWGIERPTVAPTISAVAGTDFTSGFTLIATYTWVVLDEESNRVHESSRSPAPAAFITMTAPNRTFHADISAATAPAGVTHWSLYVSAQSADSTRKRYGTYPITTTATDVTAFPTSSNPKEPYRNDPPSPSTVMGQWRNRIAMRDETDPRKVWFTGFGEIKSTLAGAPEECVSGKQSTSISDLVNEFRFPDKRTKLIFPHENNLVCFTENNSYAIVGTGGVIDDYGTRGMSNEPLHAEGSTGARAGCTTPFGAAWMTPGRKINLLSGGQVVNIGDAIQPQLNTITEDNLPDTTFFWWDGNGRKWLIVSVYCASSADLTGTPAWRLLIYDFDLGTDRPGEWFELNDHTYTLAREYLDGEKRFLLAGDASGDVWQLDEICNPTHLNRSFILGKTYLGSSLQNHPAASIRTGLINPVGDYNAHGMYISLVRGTQDGPSSTLGTAPTVLSAIDPINPDTAPTITLTAGTVKDSGDFNYWLKPETAGAEVGALAKQFQFQIDYAAGAANNGEADGRYTVAVEALFKMAFAWRPAQDIKR